MRQTRSIAKEIVTQMRNNKGSFALYVILCCVVILCGIAAVVFHNYEGFFLCLLTLVLFLVPAFIEVSFNINISETLSIIIILFIFATEMLGEFFYFYTIFPFWDILLHTLNGFLAGAIGLALVSILNHSERIAFSLSPLFCVVVAFCFSMTIGVMWEFFEFGMDKIFALDMQKDAVVTNIESTLLDSTASQHPVHIDDIKTTTVNDQKLDIEGYLDIGLFDTMEDLFVNFIGAVVFSLIGYQYLKRSGKGEFIKCLIPSPTAFDELVIK